MTKFKVSNYRSLRDVEIEIPGFTILTGKNNSGKSSILYALLTLKEILTNPNQGIEQILVVNHTLNLGGFEQIIYNKDAKLELSFELNNIIDSDSPKFRNSISPRGVTSGIYFEKLGLNLESKYGLPYTGLNFHHENVILNNGAKLRIDWNGLLGKVIRESLEIPSFDDLEDIDQIGKCINFPLNYLQKVLNIPKMEFKSPFYTEIYTPYKDIDTNVLAVRLVNNIQLKERVSNYLENITGKKLDLKYIDGTHTFSISLADKEATFTNFIVNEGTGVNHLVVILTMIFLDEYETILIDEPEVHLHPSAIKKLVSALVDINEKYGKKFIISTHSEHFVSQLLDEIGLRYVSKAKGVENPHGLSKDKVVMYLATKEGIETKLEKQEINEKGQIAGGLKNFYDEELTNFADIFSM